MAQEQDKRAALDKKTKKLSGGRIEPGKEFPAYQEAQQQLLAIQAEQQQNLALTRAESKASFDNNQTLAQAAELGAISAAEAEQAAQAGGQVNLNPATQQILSKYGAGQPHFSRSQSHSQQTTKQNIIINNNITSNTTNDVKVPANVGGPIQGRPIQMKDPGQSSTNKFKVWISQAFARQNEEWNKRDREYRNRESSLTKSANRMMKKLGEIGETIGSRMDPRKIGSTWQSQLKTLLLLFGFGYLSSNWTNILDTVAGIETWVKKTWDYFAGNGENTFSKDIKYALGAKDGESIPQALKNYLLGEDGLWGRAKDYFDNLRKERADAIKLIKTPELAWSDLDNPIEGLKKIIEYLGNVIKVALGGAEAAKGVIKSQIRGEADKASRENIKNSKSVVETTGTYKTLDGRVIKADKGLENIKREEDQNGNYVGITHHTLDENGEIDRRFGAEGGYAVSNDILRLNKEAKEEGKIKPGEVARNFERLYNAAKLEKSEGNTGIAVSQKFLDRYLGEKEQADLLEKKKIKYVKYTKVLRKKDATDKSLEKTNAEEVLVNTLINRKLGDLTGIRDYSPETLSILTGSSIVGGLVALGGGPVAALVGAYLGKKVGEKLSSAEVISALKYLNTKIKEYVSNDYRVEYVRQLRKGDIPLFDDSKTAGTQGLKLPEISSDVVQTMANKASGTTKETGPANINSTDRNFLNSLESNLKKSVNPGVTPVKNENNTELFDKLDKIEEGSKKREEEYDKKHGSDRAAVSEENIKDLVYEKTNGRYGTKKLTDIQKKRAEYAIKRLMKEGLTLEQASGIVGNLLRESGLDPETVVTDTNGKLSKGIACWNGDRYKNAERFFKQNLEDVSFENQLDYLILEMQGKAGNHTAANNNNYVTSHGLKGNVSVMEVMKKAEGVQDSTNTFERTFEISKDYNSEKNKTRIEFASTVYKLAGGDESDLEEDKKNINENAETSTMTANTSSTTTTSSSSSNNNGGSGFLGKAGSFISSSKGKISGLFGGFLNSLADLFGMNEENKQSAEENVLLSESSDTKPTITTTNEVSSETEPNYTTNNLDYSTLSGDGYSRVNDSGIFLQDKPIMDIVDVTPPELPEEPVGAFGRFQMKDKEGDLTYYLRDISSQLDAIFNINSINANATANVVDAVNQGTRAQTSSTQNTVKIMTTQLQNQTKPMPSLEGIDSSLDNLV